MDAAPQRRGRAFYRGTNGVAAARQGSHRRFSLHRTEGSGPEPL